MKKGFIMQSKDRLMRWGILSFLIVLSVCILMLHAGALTSDDGQIMPLAYSGGSGTEDDPYLVASRDDLAVIADAVNSGEDQEGVYFLMTNDIDLGGQNYDPWPTIGITIDNAAHQFRGVFDGGQFKITGLYVDRDDDDAGLFGYVGEGGVVRNVNIDTPDVSGIYWCGALAGRNYGLIEYCSTTGGYVYGSQQFVGGLVGDNHGGVIRYCYNRDTEVDCDQIGGGLVGRNSSGTVENCYNTGDVYSSNAVRGYAGGVVGENTAGSTIDNCYSTGYVEGRMASGAITGANGAGSSVTNCYYPEDCEPGVGSSSGTVENVNPKSDEDFSSGEVAWELSKGNDGEGWGQTLDGDNGEHDNHPHFKDMQDKDYETTAVYRVTFTANTPPYVYNEKLYVDPGVDVKLPEIPEHTKWYVRGRVFSGRNINADMDAVAGIRILFGGETDTIPVTGTYSTDKQSLELNLDAYMGYEENVTSSAGRFEYEILSDDDNLNAELDKDGRTLTIPAGTEVNEEGYKLKITAREKEPYIATLSMDSFGTDDVTLNVNVIINKADPLIVVKPAASYIRYGETLAKSSLTGGEAQHPVTGANVKGTFAWTDNSVEPTVSEAEIVGYSVTFTPEDTKNYNTVTALVTLEVKKLDIDPSDITPPKGIDGTYNGSAQDLIIPGSANGGTMKYWLGDEGIEYSSTIPSRANADTYMVWYKVVGDESHNDTEPECIIVTISPAEVDIIPEPVTYNGSKEFTITLNGVELADGSNETVVAVLSANSKDASTYEYDTTAGTGKYTAELSSPNYTVRDAAELTIGKLPVVLTWYGDITFTYDTENHTVEATVANRVEGDELTLQYQDNVKSAVGDYLAIVTDLDNSNYTLDPLEGAQNVSQWWHITKSDDIITMYATPDEVTYGDELTLTVSIEIIDGDDRRPADFGQDELVFGANGKDIDVTFKNMNRETGTATFTVKASSASNFYAGANAVTATYRGDSNENEGKAAVTVNVRPKPITAVIREDTADSTKIYDGNNAASGFEIKLDGVEYGDEVTALADTYTYDRPDVTATAVIANNITLSGKHSGNYVVNDSATTAGIINPKVVGLEWRGSTGLVYTGTSVNVNATAIELIPGDECMIVVENGTQTNAGTYTARADHLEGADSFNYVLPDDESLTQQEYTIYPANLYISEQTAEYNGTTEFKQEVNGVTLPEGSSDKVEVKLITGSAYVGEYTYSASDTGDSGDKTYKASTENTNYEIAGGAFLTITPAILDISGQAVEYNGATEFIAELNGVTLPDSSIDKVTVRLTTGRADADKYTYKTADEWNAGSKNYMASTGNVNYIISEKSGILTITPAKLSIPGRTVQYNGTKEFNMELEGVTLPDGEIETISVRLTASSADAGNYTCSAGNANYAAGKTYTAITDNANYSITGGDILTIEPAALYIPKLTVKYNGTKEFSVDLDGITPMNSNTEIVAVKLTASSSAAGEYDYFAGSANDADGSIYTARIDNTNYSIAGGAVLTIVNGSDDQTNPTEPDNPNKPNNPGNPGKPTNPTVSGNDNTVNDGDGNNYSEDISSNSASYADDEKIGIVSASYAGIIIIISVIAVTAFILKNKYFGQKDRH